MLKYRSISGGVCFAQATQIWMNFNLKASKVTIATLGGVFALEIWASFPTEADGSMVRINGLFHLQDKWVCCCWGYNPLILTFYQPSWPWFFHHGDCFSPPEDPVSGGDPFHIGLFIACQWGVTVFFSDNLPGFSKAC